MKAVSALLVFFSLAGNMPAVAQACTTNVQVSCCKKKKAPPPPCCCKMASVRAEEGRPFGPHRSCGCLHGAPKAPLARDPAQNRVAAPSPERLLALPPVTAQLLPPIPVGCSDLDTHPVASSAVRLLSIRLLC